MHDLEETAPEVLSFDEYAARVGREIGVSIWRTISQEDVDDFARLTGDDQWIHVDPARAASGPFGATIAHGYLTLALIPHLLTTVYRLTGVRSRINFGLNRVRFPAPVPVGSRVRARVRLLELTPRGDDLQAVSEVVIEIEGSDRPACVAETVTLIVTGADR